MLLPVALFASSVVYTAGDVYGQMHFLDSGPYSIIQNACATPWALKMEAKFNVLRYENKDLYSSTVVDEEFEFQITNNEFRR